VGDDVAGDGGGGFGTVSGFSGGGGSFDAGGVGTGFSINLAGVSGVTSNISGLVSSGSGVADDLGSQVLAGSAFAEIGSDVAAASSTMQDQLSSGLNQTMGLLGTLNTNIQASANGYAELDSAIADGFGGLGSGNNPGIGGSGNNSGTLLADAGGGEPGPFQLAAATQPSIPAAGTAPASVNTWWNGLTSTQQQQLIDASPANAAAIGSLDGVPASWRAYANQGVLGNLIQQTQGQITSLQNSPPQMVPGDETGTAGILAQQQQIDQLQTKLGGLQELQRQVQTNPNTYLLGVDTNGLGHAIVAVNNPDFADNVATLVPGIHTRLDAGSVNAYVGDAGNLVTSANTADPTSANAAVAWMNYNAPQSVPTALASAPALQGAPTLSRFQDGLYITNNDGWDLNTTVIGHSYGSIVVGQATQQPDGLDANNVIAIGSPGMDVKNAASLTSGMMQPDALHSFGSPQVFAARDDNDIIVWSEGFHSTDPVTPAFGAHVFNSGVGPSDGVAAHSYYFVPGSPAMNNMGQIITGNYQNVTPPPPPEPMPTMPTPFN
jgi:hypothetical protein